MYLLKVLFVFVCSEPIALKQLEALYIGRTYHSWKEPAVRTTASLVSIWCQSLKDQTETLLIFFLFVCSLNWSLLYVNTSNSLPALIFLTRSKHERFSYTCGRLNDQSLGNVATESTALEGMVVSG